jgi:hypothetical protein
MSFLTSPLLLIAVELIQEFMQGINALTRGGRRSKELQTKIEERQGNCSYLSDRHSKMFRECPQIPDIMSLTRDNREQNVSPRRILGSRWLLQLKLFELRITE